jgi:hypothetical protein
MLAYYARSMDRGSARLIVGSDAQAQAQAMSAERGLALRRAPSGAGWEPGYTPQDDEMILARAASSARGAAQLRRRCIQRRREDLQRLADGTAVRCIACQHVVSLHNIDADLGACTDCVREAMGDVSAEEFEDRQRIYGWRGRP